MSNRAALALGRFTLGDLAEIHRGSVTLRIDAGSIAGVEASAELVRRMSIGDTPVYGVNTGFGKLADKHIGASELEHLQVNLIRSHSVGVGEPLSAAIVRLILGTKAASLAQGFSGVRLHLIESLIQAFNCGLVPHIPSQGSVGASGDLAPLAHMTLALMGEGEFMVDGRAQPAAQTLASTGMAPLRLQAKEGLALINGTQVSTSLALHALFEFIPVIESALIVGALTVDAAHGSDSPFDPRIHALRGQPGQIDVAECYRRLLEGSEIRRSHLTGDGRVQDPYCLRCQPQVVGACLDQLRYAAAVLLREANAVTDNPLVFAEGETVLSGGNFHAEPVALAADAMAVAMAEIGAISERRIAMLIDANVSRLPPFLCADPGVNSGFMIAHVTAASLASENKSLAHPASVDSLPTSANQEDHVSMAAFAARRLQRIVDNTAYIIGIELLAAGQALEFSRPLRSSAVLEQAHAKLRAECPPMMHDRYLAPDMETATRLVRNGSVAALLGGIRDLPDLWNLTGVASGARR